LLLEVNYTCRWSELLVFIFLFSRLNWLSIVGNLTLCFMVSVCTYSHGVYVFHWKGHFLCHLHFGCLAKVSGFISVVDFSSCLLSLEHIL
jgi:hypothetical protein